MSIAVRETGTSMRGRERRLCSWTKHEWLTTAMALAMSRVHLSGTDKAKKKGRVVEEAKHHAPWSQKKVAGDGGGSGVLFCCGR